MTPRRVAIATPIRPGTTSGNDITASRWRDRLTELGDTVRLIPIDETGDGLGATAVDDLTSSDVLIALHARRSFPAVAWWRDRRGSAPMVVALAGTDLYNDLPDNLDARASVRLADRLVVLQECAVERLGSYDAFLAAKAVVITQSVSGPLPARSSSADRTRVVVLAHLREVKAPLLSATAARLLPSESNVVVDHAGGAHDASWARRATEEAATNPRYVWHGALSHGAAMTLLATADALACTSLLEGGANAVSEAIALGVPVVGTAIDGNLGLLGADYPGLVPVGDAAGLAVQFERLERDSSHRADLQRRIRDREHLTSVDGERAAWNTLLANL